MRCKINIIRKVMGYLLKKHPIYCIWLMVILILLFVDPGAAGSFFICSGILIFIANILRSLLQKTGIRIRIGKK